MNTKHVLLLIILIPLSLEINEVIKAESFTITGSESETLIGIAQNHYNSFILTKVDATTFKVYSHYSGVLKEKTYNEKIIGLYDDGYNPLLAFENGKVLKLSVGGTITELSELRAADSSKLVEISGCSLDSFLIRKEGKAPSSFLIMDPLVRNLLRLMEEKTLKFCR